MPVAVPIIAAVAGSSAAGLGIGGALFSAGVLGSIGSAIVADSIFGLVVSAGVNLVGSRLLAAKPKKSTLTQDARGYSQLVRSSVESHKVVYGTAKVSGPLAFVATADAGPDSDGTHRTGDNLFLHLVIPLAGHEVEAITTVYLNDQALTLDANGFARTAPYLKDGRSYVRVKTHLGTDTQAADPDLVTEVSSWTPAHQLLGIAYLYVRMEWNADVFPQGIPNVAAVVEGKKVYDPRTATTAWSDNAALCARDYLAGDYGFGCAPDEINDAYFIAAANVCDEAVPLAAGGTRPRYTCDGVVDTASAPLDNLAALLSALAGIVTYVQGQFRLHAGAYDAPVMDIPISLLAGEVSVRARTPKKDLFNAVQGTYVDPDKDWQPTDFPPVTNPTYEAQDGARQILKDIELPFTNHPEAAQRVAKLLLEKARQGMVVDMTVKHHGLKLSAYDVVTLTNDQMGWGAKPFRVLKWSGTGTGPIGLTLQEESSASYDWNSGEATVVDPAPDTNLPSPFDVAEPQGVAAYSGNSELLLAGDGTVITRIRLAWEPSGDAFVRDGGQVQAQYKKQADATWQDTQPQLGSASQTFIGPVDDGVAYDLRVRFKNNIGYSSDWTQIAHTVIGKTALPSDVPAFSIDGTRLSWTGVADADLAGYRIKYQPGTSRSWGDAVPMHDGLVTASPFDMPIAPAGTVTILLKAVDTSGNESLNPALIVADLGDPIVANILVTFDRKSAGWPGTLTNGGVDGSNHLVAGSAALMWNADDRAAMWGADSTALMWAAASYRQMTYQDGVTVSSALAGSTMTLDHDIAGDPWSVQYRESESPRMWNASGSTAMWNAVTATPMWAADTSGTAPWLPWPGSVAAIDANYDFLVTTGQGATQGVVSAFTIVVDAPDIDESLDNVAIASGGTRLPITETYQAILNVQLTVQTDGGGAVTARCDDKSTLGPLVKCYNAGGTAVAGTVDARIQGY